MTSMPCTRCRWPVPEGNRFCGSCGAPVASVTRARTFGAAAAGPTIPICLGCGVIAPRGREQCTLCGYHFGHAPPTVPRLHDQAYWVHVLCRFECRACGHSSPVNHLDVDGSLLCLHCGIEQRFDPTCWDAALSHAHLVGDLSGPEPEGRFPDPKVSIAALNQYSPVGDTHTFARHTGGGSCLGLQMRASPGQPLCKTCRRPLEIAERSSTELTVRCAECNEPERYAMPRVSTNARVVAVLADEHAVEKKEAKLHQDSAGVTLLSCPNCSAHLEVTGHSTVVTCTFCHASCQISAATLRSLGHSQPEELSWWLLFEGPSQERTELRDQADALQGLAARKRQAVEAKPAKARAAVTPPATSRQAYALATYVLSALTVLCGLTSVAVAVMNLLGANDELSDQIGPDALTGVGLLGVAGACVGLVLVVITAALAARGPVRTTRDQPFWPILLRSLLLAILAPIPFAGALVGLIGAVQALRGQVPLTGGSTQHGVVTMTYETFYYPGRIGLAVGLAILLTTISAHVAVFVFG